MKPKDADAILAALRERARAEADDPLADPRWEQVAAGRATEADRAALEQAARAAGVEPDAARAAFEPLSPATTARLQELAAAELVPGTPDAAPRAEGDRPGAKVVSFRARAAAVVSALALAAGVALFVATRSGEQPSFGPIPSYEVSVVGQADTRGDPPPEALLVAGGRIVVTLRPATRVEGAVEARSFLVREGRSVPLALDAVVTPEGAIRLTGVLQELGPDFSGPAELVVTVVRPGAPHDPMARPSQNAQLVRQRVVIQQRGGG